MTIFGGGGLWLAFEIAQRRLKPDEERLKPDVERVELLGTFKILGRQINVYRAYYYNYRRSIRERPNHMAGRNTKFPFSQEMIRFYSISLIRENLN